MKKKDIITLIIAGSIIAVSVVVGVGLLFPKPKNISKTSEADKIKEVPKDIDENTYNAIKNLSDYGKPNLDNLGKTDLFAGN